VAKHVTQSSQEPLQEELPAALRADLEGLIAGEELVLSVATDIKLDGHYGQAWLMATDHRLIAFSPNGGGPPQTYEVRLEHITGVKMRDLAGSGVLKVRTAETGSTVARFSKSLLEKFAPIPEQIEHLVQQQQPQAASDESLVDSNIGRGAKNALRCNKCGRLISHRAGVCPACLDARKLFARLFSYALPYWKVATFSLLLMLVATTISLTPPLLMRTMIDDILNVDEGTASSAVTIFDGWVGPYDSRIMLAVIVGMLLLINVSRNVMGALRSYLLSYLGQRVTFDLRNQVYRHLHDLSISFYNQHETGRIMASVTQDVGRLQDFISDGLQEIIRDVLTIVIICVILFYLNPTLAALVLAPTPLLVLTTLYFGKRLHTIYRSLWRRWAGISALLADTIPGVRVVKAFAQEKREVGKFESRSSDLLTGELKVARTRSLFSPIMAFITSLGTMIIWWVGGNQVLDDELTLGVFFAFTGYMWQFYGPVESLCRLNHRFQRAATSAERVFETLDAQSDVGDSPNARPMPTIEGRIEFRHVGFSYDGTKPALKDLSFTVEPGEMIGLAGHSGAGKSTLINLIARFYDAEEGTVLIDGHDIQEYGLKSLRDQIGVVLQDPFLFNGPIAENIAYGKPQARPEEIVAAAKAAHAHEFIMNLPDGYDTPVGERGVRMSGGERQRISIARAVLRDPRILILDEATSSVDTETEVKIQEALERLIKGRTTFAIAHRLSTLRHAHRLLILDKGSVAEIGSHDELIALDGIYARLCHMQTEMSKLRAW
jgi:ATP-binding cassette subfamily B protein